MSDNTLAKGFLASFGGTFGVIVAVAVICVLCPLGLLIGASAILGLFDGDEPDYKPAAVALSDATRIAEQRQAAERRIAEAEARRRELQRLEQQKRRQARELAILQRDADHLRHRLVAEAIAARTRPAPSPEAEPEPIAEIDPREEWQKTRKYFRVWTNPAGETLLEGDFLGFKDSNIHIETFGDGIRLLHPREISEKDRKWYRSILRAQKKSQRDTRNIEVARARQINKQRPRKTFKRVFANDPAFGLVNRLKPR